MVLLNKRLFSIVCLLALSTSLFSQQLKNVIIVDIPLNSTKTTAIEKLKQKGFELRERNENGDSKTLRYVKGDGFYGASAMVTLTEKNKRITEICWGCRNIDAVQLELEEELDLSPYYSIIDEHTNLLFYHWKGKTLKLDRTSEKDLAGLKAAMGLLSEFGDYGLVNSNDVNDVNDMLNFPHSITILSDKDADVIVQQHKDYLIQNVLKELDEEEQQMRRIENQKKVAAQQKRIHDSIQRENKRKQDSIQTENQRRNDSIKLEEQRQEMKRQERLIEILHPCRFLFNSDETFASCITKKNDELEKEVMGLIANKLRYIYPLVLNGKELRKEKQPGRSELIQICNMSVQLNNLKSQCDIMEIEIITHVCDYTESKLGDFVSGRDALSKAYKKTTTTSYSSFLLSYMNDK